MCGIAGFFDPGGGRSLSEAQLRAMTDAIAHRGPDGSDVWMADGVGLGHRRLAIIDLVTGDQPMRSADGAVTLIFNGEIYNFMEIRRELETLGHRFRTTSDTEVILESWLRWGERCVDRLRGMFAFALHDAREQLLFLARDRLGVKPLHYARLPSGVVIFGSELKALLANRQLPRTFDPTAVEDYFAYGYIPDPKSLLASVSKLPAGHTLTIRRGKPTPAPSRYWDIDFSARTMGKPADLAAEMVERMREAVRLRMIADVPLGAFLSGGVDSSAVVALMAEIDERPVKTCSIGFDVAGYDESSYAERVAKRYATDHHSRTVSPDDFDLIDRLSDAYDEPFADASALPTYRVCALARETVKVALSGDGADEALAGYRRYRLHRNEERVRGLVPAGLRGSLFGALGRAYPKLDWAPRPLRAKTTLAALGMSTGEAYFNSIAVLPDRLRRQLFSTGMRSDLQGYWAGSLYVDTMRDAPARDAVGQAQYADIKHWLPGDILTKVDRASMAVSLEAREPLLDHKLLEWEAGLPLDLRIRGGQGKWLMKKAMEPYLPRDLLYRPKMGFSVPLGNWFRGPLAARAAALVERSAAIDTGWFERPFLRRAFEDHRAGRADNSRLLWQLLMLDQSLGRLVDTPGAAA